jgi:flagellar biosynthesis protein FlhB
MSTAFLNLIVLIFSLTVLCYFERWIVRELVHFVQQNIMQMTCTTIENIENISLHSKSSLRIVHTSILIAVGFDGWYISILIRQQTPTS